MGTLPQRSLFSWKNVDRSPEILRLRRVLNVLPDEELIATLETERQERRDDYPIEAVWNSLIAGVVFGHESVAQQRTIARAGGLTAPITPTPHPLTMKRATRPGRSSGQLSLIFLPGGPTTKKPTLPPSSTLAPTAQHLCPSAIHTPSLPRPLFRKSLTRVAQASCLCELPSAAKKQPIPPLNTTGRLPQAMSFQPYGLRNWVVQ